MKADDLNCWITESRNYSKFKTEYRVPEKGDIQVIFEHLGGEEKASSEILYWLGRRVMVVKCEYKANASF